MVALYAAIAVAMTGLFFFLHYLGNQTPYDLARQRVIDEYAAHDIGKPGRYFRDERPLFIWEVLSGGADRDCGSASGCRV